MAKVKADAQVTFVAAGHNDVVNATQRVGDQFQRTSQQVNKTTKTMHQQFRFMRGGLGQVGHQIQDVAVQLQMGQNAMLVFGQQGSQIASLFGPHGAVIGAVLAVGAAIAVAFTGEVKEATDRAKELHEEAMGLADSFHELTGAIREQAKNKLTDQYNTLIKDVLDLRQTLSLMEAQLALTGKGMTFAGQTADELKDSILEVRAEIQRKTQDLNKVSDALDGYTEKNEDAAESEKQLAELRIETRKQIRAHLKAEREAAKEREKMREKERGAFEDEVARTKALMEETKSGQQEAIADFESATRMGMLSALSYAQGAIGAMQRVFDQGSTVGKSLFAMNQALGVANAIIAAEEAHAKALAAVPTIPAFAQTVRALGYASAGIIAGQTLASFEGGGMTPRGIRSGGMDGKGGMMAVLHPNEKVTDMERGGDTQPVNVTFNIQAHDASGFDALLAKRRGMIVGMVNRAMNERGKRGVVA